MFALIKLIQSLFDALHSEGTPGQLAAGIVLGSFLGLTPLVNLHNALIFAALVLLNVSFAGGMLGWALFVPIGFLLDPLFDWIGHSLLLARSLRGLWTSLYNTPLVPLPLFVATRWAVARYRVTVGERVRQSKFYRGHGLEGLQRLQNVPSMKI